MKTVAFFGASTGVGLSALKSTLAAGHQCIALCRTPSKLTAVFPRDSTPNLRIVEGNAHDIAAVTKCLQIVDGQFVDVVVSTIGAKPNMFLQMDDPTVCEKGAKTLIEAISALRKSGTVGNPQIIVVSTVGLSRFGRDCPAVLHFLYGLFIKGPHADKVAMEDIVIASGETWNVVRCSFLDWHYGESTRTIRVGIEDPKTGVEVKEHGWTISREDAGKWIAEELVIKRDAKYVDRTVSITN